MAILQNVKKLRKEYYNIQAAFKHKLYDLNTIVMVFKTSFLREKKQSEHDIPKSIVE